MVNKAFNYIFWQVFKNLEHEFLDLANVIHINDSQQEVYSMKIADIIIQTVVEIEALSKELYILNGGAVVPDEEMYFDTVCMNYLNNIWNLENKVVLVVSPNIYFDNDENKILKPLKKANKRGTSSADWNKAYQAIKHNRIKELKKGNIKHLLHGLAALYVLNLYYRDLQIKDLKDSEKSRIDASFGSDLFAVKIHTISGLSADGAYNKKEDYDECVYIEDHEAKSKDSALKALESLNAYFNKNGIAELEKMIKERIKSGLEVTQEWIDQVKPEVAKKVFPIKDDELGRQIKNNLSNLHYDIVLNKQQY